MFETEMHVFAGVFLCVLYVFINAQVCICTYMLEYVSQRSASVVSEDIQLHFWTGVSHWDLGMTD